MYRIKDRATLRKILWVDTLLGGVTATVGLLFSTKLSPVLGLPTRFIATVSLITLLYALVAFTLANQKPVSIPLLRTLVWANWAWTLVSIVLLLKHYNNATTLGLAF